VTFVLPSGVRVASPLVVRVAGMPAVALTRLRDEDSFALAAEVVERREWLATEGSALADALHGAIGASSVGSDKPALVGLRRSVFRVRKPGKREWNSTVAAALPADLAERVAGWVAAFDEWRRRTDRLGEILPAEQEAAVTALRELVRPARFQRALSYASPSLYAETAKWLADEARQPRRQSLVRLAKYVARAAAKTSPYSTFTSSGVGTWAEHGPAVRLTEAGAVCGVLELNGYLLWRLRDAILADERLSRALELRLNPSATLDGGIVRFLGPPPAEQIVSVPATPAILSCLRLFDGGSVHTQGTLGDRLGDGATRFIARLVDIGLLSRQSPFSDLAADPLGELVDWLVRRGKSDTAGLVERVRFGLNTPAPVNDVEGHLAWRRSLDVAIRDLTARLDLPAELFNGQAFEPVHESAVVTGAVGEFSRSHWRPVLADLDAVRRALGAIDPALPLRVSLGDFCAERFGQGSRTPFLLLYEALARDLSARGDAVCDLATFVRNLPVPDAALAGARSPRLRELSRIRRDLRHVLAPPDRVDGVHRIEAEALLDLCATWPVWISAPPSVAWYLQAAAKAGTHRVVINAAHGGYGRGRSRALHLISRAHGSPPPVLDAPIGDSPALAELAGAFGFSPNVRLASVPYEIDYPFTTSVRPARERIAVNALEVVHDPVTGLVRLFARGLPGEVKALHLGMMADVLLPAAARLMSVAFGAGYYPVDGLLQPVSLGDPLVPNEMRSLGRIEVGRVVLRRARWVVPTHRVPTRAKGEPDAAYLVKLLAWLRGSGIPTRAFVRGLAPGLFAAPEQMVLSWLRDKSRKPIYVDFASWYLVMTFERMLKGCGPLVIFEETLPDPEDIPSVTEFVIELSDPANGGEGRRCDLGLA
jgi:hypothetical protein